MRLSLHGLISPDFRSSHCTHAVDITAVQGARLPRRVVFSPRQYLTQCIRVRVWVKTLYLCRRHGKLKGSLFHGRQW